MGDGPREYDEVHTRSVSGPLQVRIGYSHDRGDVTRFLVQLEYHYAGDWEPVVRYDHDPEAPDEMAHDVTQEGLHVDIYRNGEKADTNTITGPLPPAEAFNHAEEHLTTNLEEVVRRFEQWHGIKSR